jgi:hypothetical protein
MVISAQFLTTYIVSLMKSIDIRSEPAVRLLADFLDEPGLTGRDRRGAEHFAHGRLRCRRVACDRNLTLQPEHRGVLIFEKSVPRFDRV